ncbi:PP0621 family protein [Pseudomonas jilinensis]|uniref:MYND finger n=1 Tax=Pseudomonas jilinensis TaxID=2078689 RepID=A0A396RT88_9PSED|nr:PP0621 family protein [Pseudomonas jilinensis]RHW19844.1 hypothetical protein C2846_16500 [Pseudomonas jilinensis]
MGLIKLIILVVLILAIMAFWRRLKAWQAANRPTNAQPERPQLMVRCAHCQLHLPQSQAVRAGDHWYCCPEHRDAAAQH